MSFDCAASVAAAREIPLSVRSADAGGSGSGGGGGSGGAEGGARATERERDRKHHVYFCNLRQYGSCYMVPTGDGGAHRGASKSVQHMNCGLHQCGPQGTAGRHRGASKSVQHMNCGLHQCGPMHDADAGRLKKCTAHELRSASMRTDARC